MWYGWYTHTVHSMVLLHRKYSCRLNFSSTCICGFGDKLQISVLLLRKGAFCVLFLL